MFQFSLYPDEDINHFNLTNRVIFDLLVNKDTLNKFYLDNELFDNYFYLVNHLKNPMCFEGSFDEYSNLINQKVIAQSDSTRKIKLEIVEFVKNENVLQQGVKMHY
jgi:hypothetical protein